MRRCRTSLRTTGGRTRSRRRHQLFFFSGVQSPESELRSPGIENPPKQEMGTFKLKSETVVTVCQTEEEQDDGRKRRRNQNSR